MEAFLEGAYRSGSHFGPYEILSLMGRGLMAEVYRARDPRQGLEIVLKVFLPGFSETLPIERKHEFEREAEVAKILGNHPNIVAVYEVGTWDGCLYVAMEYLAGQSLCDLIQKESLSVATALQYALQIARLLAFAHGKGMAHGHLSASQVIIEPENCVKVLGFGVLDPNDVSPSPLARSNPACFAPEQLTGEEWDHRSDVFAFGGLLYEMLSGTSPFQRSSLTDRLLAILNDQPQPLARHGLQIPQRIESVVQRCLQKKPSQRFQSIREVVCELEALLADSGTRQA